MSRVDTTNPLDIVRGACSRRIAVLAAILICGTDLSAQTASPSNVGALRIIVRDVTGLPVAGARVTVSDRAASPVATLTTTDRGEAQFDGLGVGPYGVRVEMGGFAALERADLSVTRGRRSDVALVIQIAGFEEQVEVGA